MQTDFRNIALRHKYPDLRNGRDYTLHNDFSDETRIFKWITDKVSAPSDSDMETWFQEWTAQEYARNRKKEYPPMEDQLDYMYHNGIEKWKTDMIDPVKDKYPKG